jgi:Putative addiction module component
MAVWFEWSLSLCYALARADATGTLWPMTQNVARIMNEAEQLSVAEREELADQLVESLVRDIPPEVQREHVTELRRRIVEVESGEVSLVSGEEAMQGVSSALMSVRMRDKGNF